MRISLLFAALLALCAVSAAPARAQDTTAVPTPQPELTTLPPDATAPDVVAVITNSPDHTRLAAALEAAALTATLQGDGPFTVFAPTDAAFDAIPAEHAAMLTNPDDPSMLSGLLQYHVVPGRLDAAALTERIEQADGQAALTTVNGAPLTVSMGADGYAVITDAAGHSATVTGPALDAANGVVYVIDAVLMPMAGDHMDMMNDGM